MPATKTLNTWSRARLEGQTFNRLTVLRFSGSRNGHAMFVCRCICGNEIEALGSEVKRGNPMSCGCSTTADRRAAATRHGEVTCGASTPEYRSWHSLRNRCLNPTNKAYPKYGGRGIKVCARWNDFALFLQDMGRKPHPSMSIDRIDNDGDYTPTNCRWATPAQQTRNSRQTRLDETRVAQIKRLRLDGASRTEVARRFGVAYQTVDNIDRKTRWADVAPAEVIHVD